MYLLNYRFLPSITTWAYDDGRSTMERGGGVESIVECFVLLVEVDVASSLPRSVLCDFLQTIWGVDARADSCVWEVGREEVYRTARKHGGVRDSVCCGVMLFLHLGKLPYSSPVDFSGTGYVEGLLGTLQSPFDPVH